jgi:hypothetical protein
MNPVKELLMRIRSTYDGAGTTAAAKAVGTDLANANNKASETAKKTGKEVQEAGQRGAQGLNLMGAASAAMQGNFQAAVNAVVPLIDRIQALGLSITQLSIAGAVISGIIRLLGHVRESARNAEEALLKMKTANIEKELDKISEAYNRWSTASTRNGEVRDAEYEKTQKTIDSLKREALALNELAKQRELSSVTDETLRNKIEDKYASRASGISSKYDEEAADVEGKNLLKKQQDAENDANQKLKTAREMRDAVKKIQALVDRDNAKIKSDEDQLAKWQKDSDGSSDLGGYDAKFGMKVRRWAMNEEDPETVKARRDTNAAAAKSKMEAALALEQQASSSSTMADRYATDAEVSFRNRGTSRVEASANREEKSRAEADRKRVDQEAMYVEFERLQTIATRLHPVDVEAIAADLERASKMMELTAPYIKRLADSSEQAVKAWQDNESRQRNN